MSAVAALTAAAALFAAAPGFAAGPTDRYASVGGVGTGQCTDPSMPCSLPSALSVAANGDDVTVMPGTYNLATQLQNHANVNLHGLAGAPRPVIVDAPGWNLPIIFGAGGGSLRHLAFSGAPSALHGVGYVIDADLALIEDVAVTGTNINGGGALLRGGLFRDSSVSVTTIYPHVAGIQAFAGTVRNVTTVVGGTGTGGVGLDAYSAGSDSAVSAYNVIALGTGGDVGARNASSPVQTGSATLTIDHSDFAKPPLDSGLGTSVVASNTVTGPPKLENIAAGDFHELAGSPTIDAGINDPNNGTVAFDGNPRVIGAATDIGAFEYVPPVPPVQTPPAAPTVTTPPTTGTTTSTPPALSRVSITHARFRIGRPATAVSARRRAAVGTTFRFTLNEPATVRIAFGRVVDGRASRSRCLAPIKKLAHTRSCLRLVPAGTLTRSSGAGSNAVVFSGRVGKRALRPGRYVAFLQATNTAAMRSKLVQVAFTVVAARR